MHVGPRAGRSLRMTAPACALMLTSWAASPPMQIGLQTITAMLAAAPPERDMRYISGINRC
jgi:hypothetical protein